MTSSVQIQRLAALRGQLAQQQITAFLIPKADEFQLEYVPPCNDRLAWLTEFTGSAGLAIVGNRQAALFTDNRYTEQARRQTPGPDWQHRELREGPAPWIETQLAAGEVIGYDPRLHTSASLEWLRELVQRRGLVLRALDSNPVDTIWHDRPPAPRTPLEIYPQEIAGESANSKRRRMAQQLTQDGVAALVITDPANWAWLLNVRAQDLKHTPLALGYCILRANCDVSVFLDPAQWSVQSRAWVQSAACGDTQLEDLADFGKSLRQWSGKQWFGKRVRISRNCTSEWIEQQLRSAGAIVDKGDDPCTLAKACKTSEQLAGMRAAHIRDAVALTRFLHWLSEVSPEEHTEWTLAEKLDTFRRTGAHYRSLSFRTISAFGPSAASPHYTVTRQIARPLTEGNVYLVDSGGQYVDGTTDVTRVAAIGAPSEEVRTRYTQVLRGHIALARAQFPVGINGHQLDPLARQFLWEAGVDYGHGTGHGVGGFLSVHEGPQAISRRPNSVALQPGMVVSNEPGYYKPGHFGLRIENLMSVVEVDPQPVGAESTVLGFEQLTLCPYEQSLIVTSQLRTEEIEWINAYHHQVDNTLSPLLPTQAAAWLSVQCTPLAQGDPCTPRA